PSAFQLWPRRLPVPSCAPAARTPQPRPASRRTPGVPWHVRRPAGAPALAPRSTLGHPARVVAGAQHRWLPVPVGDRRWGAGPPGPDRPRPGRGEPGMTEGALNRERPAATPELSVVLVARDGAASIGQTLTCIAAQSACHRLEVLVVAPERLAAATEAAIGTLFKGIRIVTVPRIESAGRANAAGVRAARAPVVAFAEDHCFPEPRWAE